MSLIQQLIAHMHAAILLVPNADAFAGTVTSACMQLKDFCDGHFLIPTGAGATGTTLITVEACSSAAGANPEAIAFKMTRQAPGADTADTWVGQTDVSAAGFTTTAGAKALYVIDVDGRALPDGKPFVRVKGVEVVDSPVVGCVLGILTNPKNNKTPHVSAFA